MVEVFLVGAALGGSLSMARLTVLVLVPFGLLFIAIGVHTLDGAPFIAFVGMQAGYLGAGLMRSLFMGAGRRGGRGGR